MIQPAPFRPRYSRTDSLSSWTSFARCRITCTAVCSSGIAEVADIWVETPPSSRSCLARIWYWKALSLNSVRLAKGANVSRSDLNWPNPGVLSKGAELASNNFSKNASHVDSGMTGSIDDIRATTFSPARLLRSSSATKFVAEPISTILYSYCDCFLCSCRQTLSSFRY